MALALDFRLALRTLARNKGWTAVASLALALGIGANVAIFSFVRLMLWTPLPYPHPEQLAYLPQTNPQRGFNQASVSLPDTRDWAAASGIASVAAYNSRPVAISGEGEPQHIPAMQVSPEFFPTLGVAPVLGRAFTPAESPETEARAAIISYELWQGTYRGDPAVLGRDIRLDGRNYSIVGVMPENFEYLFRRTDVWTPLSLEPARRQRGVRSLNAIARLKPGVSISQAAAEVRAISERIEKEDPGSGIGWRGTVWSLSERAMPRGARAAATSMFGAVGFVLLIACANVASLLLARGARRRREFAVRAAIGAGRASLIRLQLIESLLLSVLGGVLGILSAFATIPLLKRISPPDLTLLQTAGLDLPALSFALALSFATAIVFGLIPSCLLTRGDLAPALQESSRGSTRGRHRALSSLVAAEMALALVLVVAGGLMMRSLLRQSYADPGFDKKNLIVGTVLLSAARYPEDPRVVKFFEQVLANLQRDASLESAALVQTIPLGGSNSYNRVRFEGDNDPNIERLAGEMIVSPGYFRAMRIPLLAGREFTTADDAGARKVAIVNQTFVSRFWPNESNPIGRRLKMGADPDSPWIAVVGLARDVHHTNIADPPRPEVYLPHAQDPARSMVVVARGRGGSSGAAAAVRAAVAQAGRDQPVYRLQSFDALLEMRGAGPRATAQVLAVLAAIALILAAVGTYGVVAYTAAQRIREIGIRVALGAAPGQVFSLVLRGGLALGAIGLVIGVPAAYGVAPLLQTIDSGVQPGDQLTYGGVALLLLLVTLAASVVPAWRATRLDPVAVLREE
jgi:putative ABC transport system permease protein